MAIVWHALTAAGGLTTVIVMCACVTLLIVLARAYPVARRWTGALLAAAGTIGFAKLVFIPCGAYLPGLHLHSPSGHVAGSVAIYGGVAALLWISRPGWLAALAAAGAALLCTGVALSRVSLHAHTVPEVILGGLIGLIVPLRMLMMPGPHPDLTRPLALAGVVAVPVILAVLMVPGVRTSSEPYIQSGSRWLAEWSGVCRAPQPAAPARPAPKRSQAAG